MLLEQAAKTRFVHHRDAKFFRLVQFGPGGLAGQHDTGILRYAARDLRAQ